VHVLHYLLHTRANTHTRHIKYIHTSYHSLPAARACQHTPVCISKKMCMSSTTAPGAQTRTHIREYEEYSAYHPLLLHARACTHTHVYIRNALNAHPPRLLCVVPHQTPLGQRFLVYVHTLPCTHARTHTHTHTCTHTHTHAHTRVFQNIGAEGLCCVCGLEGIRSFHQTFVSTLVRV